jgi:hypothetical protein
LAERKKMKKLRKEQKKLLTGIGLLMEGPDAHTAPDRWHTFCPPPETRPDLSPETAVLELPFWTGYQLALAVP